MSGPPTCAIRFRQCTADAHDRHDFPPAPLTTDKSNTPHYSFRQVGEFMGVNWAVGLMRWRPHVLPTGKAYPVSHLHPFRETLLLPTSSDEGGVDVDLEVGFSLHTFTRGRRPGDSPESIYADERECRTFDEERYALSHRLPEIVKTFPVRKCYHARNQNYLSIDDISASVVTSDYRVFFVLRRSTRDPASQRPCVRLIIQSAYPTDRSGQGKERPIRFTVLLRRALGLNTGSKKAKAPHECGAP